ncbi:hypothetical protein DESC_880076 [Desulfosarcina cetonica]|nr:hypothetical protein DESC_880076 [Desulfosarcina cetonica]
MRHAALDVANDVRGIYRKDLLQGKEAVEIPDGPHGNAATVETIQFADRMPNDADILAEPIFIVGITPKRVVKVDVETEGDMNPMRRTGGRKDRSEGAGQTKQPNPDHDEEKAALTFGVVSKGNHCFA